MSAPAVGLADIPALLDLVAQHKYNVGHVKIALPRHAVVAFHAGTSLPSQISGLGELAAGTLVYTQEWHCCGEYSCSSGNGKKSARGKCSAVAVLKIESTGVKDQFRVSLDEPDAGKHGSRYVAPPANAAPRTLYRTKVATAEAAARGLSYDGMVNELPEHLRPVGRQAVKTFRRRFDQQTKTQTKRSAAAAVAAAAAPSAPKKKARRSAAKVAPDAGATKSDDEHDDEAAHLLTMINHKDDDDDDDDDKDDKDDEHDNEAARLLDDDHGADHDVDFAAALLARREVPWQEMCSVDAAAAKLAPLDDIGQRLAALDVAEPLAADSDESDESDSVTIVSARVPTTAMFARHLVDPLLADHTCAVVRQRFRDRVQAPRADEFAEVGVDPQQQHWRKIYALVPKTWYKSGKLMVGKSTAEGQCLFSSVAMLLYGRRDDDVALWLRARCTFELLEQWLLYETWFDERTMRETLAFLVRENPNSRRYGFDWPVAETLWVLANVLRRRIVVVRKLQQRMAAKFAGDKPFVVLPVRHAVGQWTVAPPLVVLQNANHYQPLSGVVWNDEELRLLRYDADMCKVGLRTAVQPLVGHWCSQQAESIALD